MIAAFLNVRFVLSMLERHSSPTTDYIPLVVLVNLINNTTTTTNSIKKKERMLPKRGSWPKRVVDRLAESFVFIFNLSLPFVRKKKKGFVSLESRYRICFHVLLLLNSSPYFKLLLLMFNKVVQPCFAVAALLAKGKKI